MGEFIDLILNNLFLVIVIISGIVGVFNSSKEQKKKQQEQNLPRNQRKEPVEEKPVATPSRPKPSVQKRQTRSEMELKPEVADVTSSTSIENERQAQMNRLKAKYRDTESAIFDGDLSHQGLQIRQALEPRTELSEEQELLKKDIRKNLRSKGLINGIIMAEILGKPRSLKPYQSVSMERYKR